VEFYGSEEVEGAGAGRFLVRARVGWVEGKGREGIVGVDGAVVQVCHVRDVLRV